MKSKTIEIKKPEDFLLIAQCGSEFKRLFKAVDEFAFDMKMKLANQTLDGYTGWDDESELENFNEALFSHIEKGDMVDVANFAMFIRFIEKRKKEKKKRGRTK